MLFGNKQASRALQQRIGELERLNACRYDSFGHLPAI